jgi:hypothetical protein
MRLLIGIFISFMIAVIARDLGLRLPLDLEIQLGILGVLIPLPYQSDLTIYGKDVMDFTVLRLRSM